MSRTTTDALYLVTIVTFILALRFLSSPKHARKGNWIGASGMALAIVVTDRMLEMFKGRSDRKPERDGP